MGSISTQMSMPSGFVSLPLPWPGNEGILRLCLIASRREEEIFPVSLHLHEGASSYLGCLQDSAGAIRQWVELVVQKPAADDSDSAKWRTTTAAMQELCCKHIIWTGWENTRLEPLHLTDDRQSLEVCETEAASAFFNSGRGRVLTRDLFPISFEAACDLLGGATSGELLYGRVSVKMGTQTLGLPLGAADGILRDRTLVPQNGRAGALLEALCLKLRMYGMAVSCVGETVKSLKRPLLNLTPDSFGVRFAEAEHNLAHWCFEVGLLDYGDATVVSLPAQAPALFSRRDEGTSLYRAPVGEALEGHCAVRLPAFRIDGDGRLSAEITLTTQDRLDASPSDIVCVQVELPQKSVELFATVREGSAMAGMEWKLQTLPQLLPPETIAALRGCEGELLRGCHFRILRACSLPCDVYSLAVLGAREFLVGKDVSLPVAMDRLLSLAQHLSLDSTAGTIESRVAAAFSTDSRWQGMLGPQRLLTSDLAEQEIASALPAEVWYGVLSLLIRMLPGRSQYSYCRDYGSPGVEGVDVVFAPILGCIDGLRLRCLSLLVGDGMMNQEVRTLIGKLRGSGASAPRPQNI